MKLRVSYDSLISALEEVKKVAEDKASSDDMKNVIFRIDKTTKEIKLIGLNQIIVYRRSLSAEDYEVEVTDEEFGDRPTYEFQVKSGELKSFLDTFKTTSKTEVQGVQFANSNNKIVVTVMETDDNDRAYSSTWVLDNIRIKPNLLPRLDLAMPSELDLVDNDALQLTISTLLPIMDNSLGSSLFSKLAVSKDYIVAYTKATTTIMSNMIGGVFENFVLSYRAVSFLKDVICLADQIETAKTEQYLAFKTEKSEAFIILETKLPNYESYIKLIDKTHAIVLDRQYLKDVLKRLSLVDEKVSVSITSDDMGEHFAVKNTKFSQELDILQTKDLQVLGAVNFKIMPQVLIDAIVGDDKIFSDELFVYLAPRERGGYVLSLSDKSGKWATVCQVV